MSLLLQVGLRNQKSKPEPLKMGLGSQNFLIAPLKFIDMKMGHP